MKEKTIETFIKRCQDVIKSKMTRNSYEVSHDLSSGYFYKTTAKILQEHENGTIDVEVFNTIIDILTKLDSSYAIYGTKFESDGNEEYTTLERDENDLIKYYKFRINRKNKRPIIGKLSRDEMETICRLYTYYGQGLTRRELSRYFNEWSLEDFKKILGIWGLQKDSCPLPQHIIEENDTEALLAIQARNKENDFMRKAEQQRIKATETLLNKVQLENYSLKQKLSNYDNISFTVSNNSIITIPKLQYKESTNEIILYLADMHVGANITSNPLYTENINYGEKEINRRLESILTSLNTFPRFNTIRICLMGDMIDSCGVTNKTARLDHSLPENMDGYEQAESYINIIDKFVKDLINMDICNNIQMFSVRDGNHTGPFEYVATKALFNLLKKSYNIECTLFKEFLGVFNVNNNIFCISHGKDAMYMKRGMPLVLDDKNKVKMYEWFESKNIYGDNIHIVKADLHSNALSSCKKFDYRNVLSLFGSSDHSAYNYTRNSYGVSYDLFIGDNLVRGTFENM